MEPVVHLQHHMYVLSVFLCLGAFENKLEVSCLFTTKNLTQVVLIFFLPKCNIIITYDRYNLYLCLNIILVGP